MTQDQQFDGRHELVSLLLEIVKEDPYPSTTMMDHIEQLMQPEEVPAYIQVLLDKIRSSMFPSLDLIARVRAVS